MLLKGAKLKVIREALGKASVALTMYTYSHMIEGMLSDTMALLDEVLPLGENGVSQQIYGILAPRVDMTGSKSYNRVSSQRSSVGRAVLS